MRFQAGYAQAAITPDLARPVYLAGFGRNRRATSVHDDLYVRVLALAGDNALVALAAVDLIGLARHHCAEIEAAVTAVHPQVQVVVAATHTHHGPDMLGIWGPDETTRGVDGEYFAATMKAIADTILAAFVELREATLCSAAINTKGLAKNIRNPAVTDEELTVLQIADAGTARPIASVAIYPCHPEVLWDENPHITSDYCATLRTTIEGATQGPALVIVGALGGMMTPDVDAHTFDAAQRMGARLGAHAVQALANARVQPVPHLAYARQVFSLPLANPLFVLAMQGGILEGPVDEHGALTTECSLLRLGDTWLLGVPGELLPRLGLAYKAAMRAAGARTAAVIGLANDEIGYIVPEDEFVYPDDPFAPGDHYEESMSLGIETAPRLTAAVNQLLEQAGWQGQEVAL